MNSQLVEAQQSLWGRTEPAVDPSLPGLRRTDLGHGAWVDRAREWVTGHSTFFEELRAGLRWRTERRRMYERVVETPRLLCTPKPAERPSLLDSMARALSARYGETLDQISCALYRDGSDSVAFHQDKVLRDRPDSTVAVVSLEGPRHFLVRPLHGGASTSFSVGWGDLLVMGGTCQRLFEHGVPKVRHAAPRMAIMFRSHSLR